MEEIYRRIPHRSPFLFVDRIIEINPDDEYVVDGKHKALVLR